MRHWSQCWAQRTSMVTKWNCKQTNQKSSHIVAWIKQYTTRKAKILKVKYINTLSNCVLLFYCFQKRLTTVGCCTSISRFESLYVNRRAKEQVVCFLRQEKKGEKVFAHMAMLSFTPIVSFRLKNEEAKKKKHTHKNPILQPLSRFQFKNRLPAGN